MKNQRSKSANKKKIVKFTKDESSLLESINARKQKYNGRGQDPKCVS
jgi:hypothetical protein